MIILRQKEYGRKKSSLYNSQQTKYFKLYLTKNGERVEQEPEILGEINRRRGSSFTSEEIKAGKAVKYKNGNFHILNYQGREVVNPGERERGVYHEMVSDKSPKETYRDWLRSVEERMKQDDLVYTEPTVSNKEIKEQLRKAAKKRNIQRAAPWVIGGTIATAGTVAGIKAYKKHKKDKKK